MAADPRPPDADSRPVMHNLFGSRRLVLCVAGGEQAALDPILVPRKPGEIVVFEAAPNTRNAAGGINLGGTDGGETRALFQESG